MSEDQQLTALVALLHGGPLARTPMVLRQRLVCGDDVLDIVRDEGVGEAQLEVAARQLSSWRADGLTTVSGWTSSDYPQRLRDVHDFPPVVFTRGRSAVVDRGVCVVGSREVSAEALTAAAEISRHLVAAGRTVVSGLAKGIDTAAHRAALTVGGRTVAVIGNGIDHYYPAQNRSLQQQVERDGLVLSQFWPGTRGARHTFPMRNAVMSAYAEATIIVAAGESSGTRHQAHQAVAHGRPLVLSATVARDTSWGRELAEDQHAVVLVAHSAEQAAHMACELADRSLSVGA